MYSLCISSPYPKRRKDLTATMQMHAAGSINIVQVWLPEPEDVTTVAFISETGQFRKKILHFVTLLGGSHFKSNWDYLIDNCRYAYMAQIKFQDIYLETTKMG